MRLMLAAILLGWLGSQVEGEPPGCLKSDVYPRVDVAFLQGACPKKETNACEDIICSSDSDTYEHHTCSGLSLCQDELEQCYMMKMLPASLAFPECCRTEKEVCPGDPDYDLQELLNILTYRSRRAAERR